MPPVRCLAFGHRIATDIALPGAVGDDGALAPEIVIRRRPPRPAREDRDTDVWREGDTLHFAPRGVASYRCTAPSAIDVAPCPGAEEGEIVALLIATALPGLLWLRGGFVLHAAAAVLPTRSRAVAVAGASGAGKSTLLAAMAGRGARVVADDSVRLRSAGSCLVASGLPGGWFAHHPDPAARPFVAVDPERAVVEAPLGAILLPAPHDAVRPAAFRRLPPLEALAAILSHRHRPAVPALFGDPARRLADAARVARTPIYRWSRPSGPVDLTDAEWQTLAGLNGDGDDG